MSRIIKFLQHNYINVISCVESSSIEGKSVIYINPFNYFYLRKNLEMLDNVYYRTDGIYVTSFISWLNKTKYKIQRQSFDMTSLAPLIFKFCSENQKSIFICGGTEEDIQGFVSRVKKEFPQLMISGQMSGYENKNDIISEIIKVECDFVLLGLGNRKQEEVLLHARKQKNATYFTCGAFISQTARSKGIHYYPKIYDKLHLRWLYRLINEKQTRKRVLFYYPKFFFVLIFDWLNSKFN